MKSHCRRCYNDIIVHGVCMMCKSHIIDRTVAMIPTHQMKVISWYSILSKEEKIKMCEIHLGIVPKDITSLPYNMLVEIYDKVLSQRVQINLEKSITGNVHFIKT
jgi:hypothetical protein